MHILLEVAAAGLVVVPLFAVGLAYRRTRSMRLLLAFAAFAVLEARFIVILAGHSLFSIDHVFEETIDYLADIIVIALFAAAFLYSPRGHRDRPLADLA